MLNFFLGEHEVQFLKKGAIFFNKFNYINCYFFRKKTSFLSIHLHTNLAINLCILNLIFVNVGCENSFFYLSICWHDRYTYINASYLSPKNYMKRSLMKWIWIFSFVVIVLIHYWQNASFDEFGTMCLFKKYA